MEHKVGIDLATDEFSTSRSQGRPLKSQWLSHRVSERVLLWSESPAFNYPESLNFQRALGETIGAPGVRDRGKGYAREPSLL